MGILTCESLDFFCSYVFQEENLLILEKTHEMALCKQKMFYQSVEPKNNLNILVDSPF